MTTLDYLEKIDDTLAHWEDYFHGQEGTDVTEARANLDKVRKQLLIPRVVNCKHEDYTCYYGREGELMFKQCNTCNSEFD